MDGQGGIMPEGGQLHVLVGKRKRLQECFRPRLESDEIERGANDLIARSNACGRKSEAGKIKAEKLYAKIRYNIWKTLDQLK